MFSLPRIGFCYVLTATPLRQRICYRFASGRSVFDQENGLFSVPVRFKNNRGDVIQLDAVYQDTMPDGGEKAVFFGLHGSPGSHADFKYLAPELKRNGVRMVMPNYPGMGYTAGDRRLSCENEERNEFTQAVLDSLDNVQSPHLYFIGHSRGGDNALQMATLPQNVKKVRGVIMLNAAGLQIHRGIEPLWKIDLFVKLLDLRVFNIVVHPFLYFVYNQVFGLRAPSGAAAAMALRSMQTFAFDRLLPCVDVVNRNTQAEVQPSEGRRQWFQIRFLHAYSGDDFLIQPDVSKEFASKLDSRIELECSADDSAAITRSTIEAFSSGYQAVSVNFTKEGHFLQKFRAGYLVDVILALTRI